MTTHTAAKTQGNFFFLVLAAGFNGPLTWQLIQGTADLSGFGADWLTQLISWAGLILYIFMWSVLAVAVNRIIANIRLKSGTIKTNG